MWLKQQLSHMTYRDMVNGMEIKRKMYEKSRVTRKFIQFLNFIPFSFYTHFHMARELWALIDQSAASSFLRYIKFSRRENFAPLFTHSKALLVTWFRFRYISLA